MRLQDAWMFASIVVLCVLFALVCAGYMIVGKGHVVDEILGDWE